MKDVRSRAYPGLLTRSIDSNESTTDRSTADEHVEIPNLFGSEMLESATSVCAWKEGLLGVRPSSNYSGGGYPNPGPACPNWAHALYPSSLVRLFI